MKFGNLTENMLVKIVVDDATFIASEGDKEEGVSCAEHNMEILNSVKQGSKLKVLIVLEDDSAFILATDDSTYYFAAHEASMFEPA